MSKICSYRDEFFSSHSAIDSTWRGEVDGEVAGHRFKGVIHEWLQLEVVDNDRPHREDDHQIIRIFLFVHSLNSNPTNYKLIHSRPVFFNVGSAEPRGSVFSSLGSVRILK